MTLPYLVLMMTKMVMLMMKKKVEAISKCDDKDSKRRIINLTQSSAIHVHRSCLIIARSFEEQNNFNTDYILTDTIIKDTIGILFVSLCYYLMVDVVPSLVILYVIFLLENSTL